MIRFTSNFRVELPRLQPLLLSRDVFQLIKDGAEGGRFELRCGDAVLEIRILEPTGGWNAFDQIDVGRISIPSEVGDAAVLISIRALSIPGEAAGNLRSLILKPV